ncbi:type IV pilus modification PilV family protein [Desulforhabdus amnigena]|jgi:prepilin-type N-terminal cleavage/methylation domain-containing protein|uniref:Prepilin-type N-terminal cleavage/methylation domain-containing protein n=1 Tax=Desulforhabdus amnigena TaxID=40218 RepID=A0A9W6D3V0_9BACT|nr:prepilin-type N-terminal cleavage/methylation domain-containing protein [Desulforhabdus amnigena]NLJ26811.1 prepilin-type N-terminal cleavage/methylation domain-containing protein [Deltaproteobacteria bacterium]GLI34768.1 hypothetical protein DAMNIGENAA_22010 [Desulforhabdus amnigena]
MNMQSILRSKSEGFTLLEVMVGLIVGTIIAGGVMGLISVSLQYKQRLKEKSRIQPVLEAVAQEILANPQSAAKGNFILNVPTGSPPVDLAIVKAEESEKSGSNRLNELYRVFLKCNGQILEFSLIIPQSQLQ